MSLQRFLIISIIVHAGLFFSLQPALKPASTQNLIEVEFQEHQTAQSAGKAKGNIRATAKRPARKSTALRKLDLGLSTMQAVVSSYQKQLANPITPNSTLESEGNSKVSFDPYDGMAMPEIRFVRSLWREIDKSIVNNPYLSEYGHTGKAFFSFQVGTDGKLIENTLTAKSEDRVLKVIAARAIRKALQNQNGELSLPTENMTIYTQFAWSDLETCASMKGSSKNHLSFCNYAEDKRKNFSDSEKAATYLGALRYGFDAADEIKKYQREEMHRNSNFNPFEEFERDPDWNLGT
jgi:hypothetical protein